MTTLLRCEQLDCLECRNKIDFGLNPKNNKTIGVQSNVESTANFANAHISQ